MKHQPSKPTLEQIFEAHIQILALTLRPGTVKNYRIVTRLFLGYLHASFPQISHLSQLHRDPHLHGWFRWLCEHHPPLCNTTRQDYLVRLRGLLDGLAANGHPVQPELIRRDDFPPRTQYLPKPLALEEDQRLHRELRRTDDLYSNALLLIRLTGIRIGECMDLALDCLRQLGPDQWALHVPLGKLHTERLVPSDSEVRRILARIIELRALARPTQLAKSEGLLLPRGRSRLVSDPPSSLGRGRQTSGLFLTRDASSVTTQLCHGDATARRQSSRSYATTRAQRHRHDLTLCPGHPTRPAA